MATTVPVPGSERKRPAESKYIEPLGDDENVVVTLLIRSPADSPSVPDLDYWQNTPLTEQRFISSDEYVRTYGSSQTDLNKVVAIRGRARLDCTRLPRWTRYSQGARVCKTNQCGLWSHNLISTNLLCHEDARVTMTRKLTFITASTAMCISHTTSPASLRRLSALITVQSELQQRTGDPPFSIAPLPSTLAGYYNFPNAGASDQVIGIPEFAPAGYLETDYTKYYFPSLPTGYDTIPNINPISLVGASNQGPNQLNSGETMVDISVSGTIAQGATINVYFTDWSEPGWVDFLYRVLVPSPW